jgi:hypothetical protein
VQWHGVQVQVYSINFTHYKKSLSELLLPSAAGVAVT